jgi:ribokinase
MYDLISIGAIKLDTFIVLDGASVICEIKKADCKLCIPYGEKIPVAAFATEIAGSAPNVAVGLSRMGLKTALLSILGDDAMKAQALAFLKKNKVDASLIKTVPGTRNSAAVVLNYKGESTQLVDHVPHEYKIPTDLPETKMLHISELGAGYENLYREAVRLATKGVGISLNPGAVQLRERKPQLFELIGVSKVLFLNIVEARKLLENEHADIHGIVGSLKALGPEYVVVTDGAKGAYAYDGKQLDVTPAFPTDFKEATGAGDAFSAGFLGAILKGKTHREALLWASVLASSAVEHVGPTKGLISHTEIIKRLKEHPTFQTKEL